MILDPYPDSPEMLDPDPENTGKISAIHAVEPGCLNDLLDESCVLLWERVHRCPHHILHHPPQAVHRFNIHTLQHKKKVKSPDERWYLSFSRIQPVQESYGSDQIRIHNAEAWTN
jgi:hypothetical protein